jgi:hypothetical protein
MAESRTIGPVTTGATAGGAAAIVLVYIVEQLTGLDVPTIVEGAVAVLLTVTGGLLVKPQGRHE